MRVVRHDPELPLVRPRRLVVSTRWLVLLQAAMRALSLVALIAFVRTVGPAFYGFFYTAVMLVANWTVLTQGGLRVGLMDRLAQHPAAAPDTLAQALSLRLAAAVLTLALAGFHGWLEIWDHHLLLLYLALLAIGLLNALSLTYEEALFSADRLGGLGWLPTISALVANLSLLIGSLLGRPMVWILASQGALAVVSLVLLALSCRSRLDLRPWRLRWNAEAARNLGRAAAGPAVRTMLAVWYGRADLLVARGLLTDEAVGIYCVALRLIDMALAAVIALAVTLQPVLTAASANPGAQYRAAATALRAGALLLVPICLLTGDLAFVLLAPFGAALGAGHAALGILIWVILWAYFNAILHHLLLRAGRGWDVAACLLCGLLVSIGVGFYAVPRWGLAGAAAARVLGEMTVCAASVVALRQLSRMGWTTIVLKPAGMGLAMAAAWMLWPAGPWFWRSPASLAVYVLLAALIRPLSRREWGEVWRTIKERVTRK